MFAMKISLVRGGRSGIGIGPLPFNCAEGSAVFHTCLSENNFLFLVQDRVQLFLWTAAPPVDAPSFLPSPLKVPFLGLKLANLLGFTF